MSTMTNGTNYNLGSPITVNAPPAIAALDTNTYTGASASGEASSTTTDTPSTNYTPPAVQNTALQNQSNSQNSQANQQAVTASNPLGMSPSNIGTIGGKVLNTLSGDTGQGTFSTQINAINDLGAKYLGTAGSTPLSAAAAQQSGEQALTAATSGTNNLAIGDFGTSNLNGAYGINLAPAADVNSQIAAGLGGSTTGGSSASGAGLASSADLGTAAASTAIPEASALQGALGIAPDSTLGSLTAAGSLTGVLGAAGLGALGGGYLASLEGGNSTGGSIGGAIGAAGGMAIGGPLGALIGGAIGGSIGGLFGNNSPATQASGTGGQLTKTGAIPDLLGGGKNGTAATTGIVNKAENQFSTVAQAASSALGINFNPATRFQANYSSQHGGANIDVTNPQGTTSSGTLFYDPSNTASFQSAELTALQDAALAGGYTDTKTLTDWFNNYVQNPFGQGGFTPAPQPIIPASK